MAADFQNGFRLSPQQRRLWTLLRAKPTPSLFAQCSIQINGHIHRDLLKAVLEDIVKKHEILRTTFRSLPNVFFPLQVITEKYAIDLPYRDLCNEEIQQQESILEDTCQKMRSQTFDLEHGPLFYVSLFAVSPNKHVLIVILHALCGDKKTLYNLTHEICRAYSRQVQNVTEEEETLQFVDLAEWQNELIEADDMEAGRKYWRKQSLAHLFSPTLPFEQQASDQGFCPARFTSKLAPETVAAIDTLIQQQDVTFPAFLLTCWHILLWRVTEQSNGVMGIGYPNRRYEELQNTLGLFALYLPLKYHINGNERCLDFLKQIDEILKDMDEWQECFSWEQVDVQPPSSIQVPYFPLNFDFEEFDVTKNPTEQAEADRTYTIFSEYVCTDRFNLRLSCVRKLATCTVELYYDAALFSTDDITCLLEQFCSLVENVVHNPHTTLSKAEILSPNERQKVLVDFNRTQIPFPDRHSIVPWFEEQVLRTPDAIALLYEEEYLTFNVVNTRVNCLAHYLQGLGVGPEVRVGIYMERSVAMVIGLLGILKAGGAYVPLAPDYPAERLAFMLTDAQVPVLLTQKPLLASLPPHTAHIVCIEDDWRAIEHYNPKNPVSSIRGGQIAYVLYTSGSTGQPKGVMIPHHALYNHMSWMQHVFPLQQQDRILQKTPFSFDASVWEFYAPLLNGAQLVVAQPGLQQDASALLHVLITYGITTLQVVPSLLRAFLFEANTLRHCSALRAVFCGGEKLPFDLQQQFAAFSAAQLHNLYGPTETCIDATTWQCERDNILQKVYIGRPIANTYIFILDENQCPVPIGLTGELYIGGSGLARGYSNRPDLTAEKFIPDPFSLLPGKRLYRTNDLGRFRPDGTIEYLGRLGSQTKIRGFRVELGEIESVLEQHPAVTESIVLTRQDKSGEEQIAAYFSPNHQHAFTVLKLLELENNHTLREQKLHELPNSMLVAYLNKSETDYLYKEIFEDQAYTQGLITFNEDDCIFDIGANIGFFTLLASRMCGRSTIYAFEPIPAICNVLRINAGLYNPNVKVFECGIGDTIQTASFSFRPNVSVMSGRYVNGSDEKDIVDTYIHNQQEIRADEKVLYNEMLEDRLRTETVMCQIRTLSDVIREYNVTQIDVLKIDVEKSELDVLEGIAEEDWPKIKQIILEVYNFADQDRVKYISSLLEQRGFVVTIQQLSSLQETNLYNLFAVHTSFKRKNKISLDSHWYNPRKLIEDVQTLLVKKLPRYMVPSHYFIVNEWPLTPNGKIDRKALSTFEQTYVDAKNVYVAPRTQVESILSTIWSEILGIERVGVTTNFFDVGGHSLLVTQVLSRVQQAFGVSLSIRSVFEMPTIVQFAQYIENISHTRDIELSTPLLPTSCRDDLPLSSDQTRLWFMHQLAPHSPVYNMFEAFHLQGPLNIALLQQSLQEIVRRHEVLRTTFSETDGQPRQVVASPNSFSLRVILLQDLLPEVRRFQVEQLSSQERHCLFDLAQGPLLRVTLLKLAEEEHLLMISVHHIVFDGWSLGLFWQELEVLYAAFSHGAPSPLAPLPIQYADYALWQRKRLQGDLLLTQVEYWKQQLRDLPSLQLPTDYPRPDSPSFRGSTYYFGLPSPLARRVKELSQQEDVTLFMTLLSAFQVLLLGYTGQEDLIVNVGITNRTLLEFETLMGFFVNSLVLRTDLSGDPTFRALLGRVREVTLEAYAHQDLPFEQLIAALRLERNVSNNPLNQVVFTLQNAPTRPFTLPKITVQSLQVENTTAKGDLLLFMWEDDQTLQGAFEYTTDLFRTKTIARMAEHLQMLLESIVRNADQHLSALKMSIQGKNQPLAAARSYDRSVDYAVLPSSRKMRPELTTPYVAARSFFEQQLTEIWIENIGVEPIGIYDNFFELGGHSLLDNQIITRVQDIFHVNLPIQRLIENPNIAKFTVAILQELAQKVDESTLTQLLAELK